LGSEGNTACHLCVGPDFALQRLDLEDFVLEEHRILCNCLSDRLVLAAKGSKGLRLAALLFRCQLILVVTVVRIKTAVVVIIGKSALVELSDDLSVLI